MREVGERSLLQEIRSEFRFVFVRRPRQRDTVRQIDPLRRIALRRLLYAVREKLGLPQHEFIVQQAGQVSVKLSALAPDDTISFGLSLGTWNGAVCSAILSNDKAALNTTVTGNAQNTGFFCARVYDAAGSLTASTDYTIDITHF